MKIKPSVISGFFVALIMSVMSASPLVHIPQQYFDALYTQAYHAATPYISTEVASRLNKHDCFASLSIFRTQVGGRSLILKTETDALYTEIIAQCAYKLIDACTVQLFDALDALEKSSLYWQWSVSHPVQYAATQSPRSWFTARDYAQEAFEKQERVQHLLQECTAKYGCMMKYKACLRDLKTSTERLVWASDVVHFLAEWTQLRQQKDCYVSLNDLANDIIVLQERVPGLYVYNLDEVQIPTHWKRRWLAYTAATLGVAATAWFAAQHWDNITTGCATIKQGAANGFDEQIAKPFVELKDEMWSVLWPQEVENITAKQFAIMDQQLDKAQSALVIDSLKSSKIPGSAGDAINYIIKSVNEGKTSIHESFDGVRVGFGLLKRMNAESRLTFKCFTLIPATVGFYTLYKGLSGVTHWFRKYDRRLLRAHLFQAHDILIRAQHELSDTEYGRLMYVLIKESVQAKRNVRAHERDVFMQDLQYLALPTPTMQQKKEVIAQMWHKYEALSKDI